MFENKRIKTQLVLFYNATEEGYEDYIREFYSAAKQLLGEVYCLKANLATSDRLLKYFGIFQNPTSAVVVFVCSHSRQSFVERSHGRRIPEEVPISRRVGERGIAPICGAGVTRGCLAVASVHVGSDSRALASPKLHGGIGTRE